MSPSEFFAQSFYLLRNYTKILFAENSKKFAIHFRIVFLEVVGHQVFTLTFFIYVFVEFNFYMFL